MWQRPRLQQRISSQDARLLIEQLRFRAEIIVPTTVPPRCRDPKDHPVLATSIDGHADAIVSGDTDLRADDELRVEMQRHSVALWDVDTLLERSQGRPYAPR